MKKDRFSFIRYSNCWEDTDILLSALDVKEGERGLSVCSGGDNTLSMLVKNPREVVAFDLNPTQLYCMKFKIAAFRTLEYHEVLELLGVDGCRDRLRLFEKIKPQLDIDAREFFEKNTAMVEQGLIHAGKFEHYFGLFKKYLLPFICSREKVEQFFALSDGEEQRAFYEKHIDNFRLGLIVKIYFGSQVMGALGRDKSFFDFVEEKKTLSTEVKKRFERGISNTENCHNPYLFYVFNNRFTHSALPHYLREENFEAIKRNLDRITLVQSDLLGIEGKFDFCNLSDIFEYMSHEDFLCNVEKMAALTKDGARIAYWNMQNRQYIEKDGFVFREDESKALFKENKSCFYRDFLLYERKSNS